jgi:hypothetical protein
VQIKAAQHVDRTGGNGGGPSRWRDLGLGEYSPTRESETPVTLE